LKGQPGNNFPRSREARFEKQKSNSREGVHVLIVDSVLGSRFSLMQAASLPGFVVDACAGVDDARARLARTRYSLVLTDEKLTDGAGLELLEEVRERHPSVARALISAEGGLDFKRAAIHRGGLAFLLSKPLSPETLRRTLRELFVDAPDGSHYAGWEQWEASAPRVKRASDTPIESSDSYLSPSHDDVLLRGLLAGLNSCENEDEVFELIHAELADAFRVTRWLWVDEDRRWASAISGDWAIETQIPIDALGGDDRSALRHALRINRVTRLDDDSLLRPRGESGGCCVGLAIRIAGRRAMTAIVWADAQRATALVSVLRELQRGLQMAIQRIREAESRAKAAHELARRVSEELRTPVGALTHAIDRLKGEAERAGLSNEWVDRISSESERVVRAVEHLEGEMLAPTLVSNAPTI